MIKRVEIVEMKNMPVEIKEYSADLLEACVSVLAGAFVDNPLHVSALGRHRFDRNRLFFRFGLRHMFGGAGFVALAGGAVCGYMHFNAAPYCLPAPEEIPGTMAALFKPLDEATPRLIQWFGRWCRLDPDEPHVHLGPIGVAPAMQGKGIGTALMHCYIEHLQREKTAGYLETDRPENAEFYKKFGFVVRHEETVIGVPTWYLWRPQ